MPKYCVKKPFTVVVAVIMVLVLGVISFMNMTTDLLPTIELPYVVVVTTYPGASPERVETGVTAVLEAGLGTVNGVADVSSISNENYSMIILEFESGSNMDSAMVKLSTAVDQVKGYLPDTAGTPMLLELSPDMLPVMVASVDMEGMDIYELSKFAEDTVVPCFERQAGVASVDSTGLVEKTVEVRLDEAKIEALNTKVLASVDERLDDAQKELDDAAKEVADGQAELQKGKDELQNSKDALADQQATLSEQLAQGSTELDSASARLNAMLAEKDSLTAEKKIVEAAAKKPEMEQALILLGRVPHQIAYTTALTTALNGVIPDIDPGTVSEYVTIRMALNSDETMRDRQQEIEGNYPLLSGVYDQIVPQVDALMKYQPPTNATEAIPIVEKITADQLAMAGSALPAELAGKSGADIVAAYRQLEGMVALYGDDAGVAARAAEIESRLKVLALSQTQLEQALAAIKENQTKLEEGKLSAAIGFGSGTAQMAAAEASLGSVEEQLKSAEEQLKDAREQFEDARAEAFQNADVSKLITKDMLSGLILAQNFAMPAGYLYQGEDQYLLRVGDAFDTVEDLENALLMHMDVDGVGDVRLSDVATVTLIDNAGDSYAKVNGNQAVVLSISKASTAGTSDVSKALNSAIEELEAEHEGLRIAPLMDQGQYIKLIVDSVLSNLGWGAVLAIAVLALFLKSLRPTAVVAFSIPISLMFAVVLMYFSNVTLNIISLSGLALGVGMLVDNSIVVIENIYRLRSEGMPAAQAAVKGANQVAGAIAASTLTTVCVFLPIVFTEGLTRQLFTDMGLTIAYSLCASLIVALTLVPCMGATLLKKDEKEKKHPWFDALVAGYEKTLRFCLKYKAVPLLAAVALLALAVWQTTRMGLEFLPEMGGNQMSVTVTAPEEATKEEAYALADTVMEAVQQTDGVELVGAISSSGGMSMMGGGGSGGAQSFSYYVILDEEASKNNQVAADAILEKTAGLDAEISVSTSNMDMSALGGSGMQLTIQGRDLDTLLDISEEMMDLLGQVEGFGEITNGQEEGDTQIRIRVHKDEAMRYGLTVAQIFSELSDALTTEATATTLTVGGEEYDVVVVDETHTVDRDNLMAYEFETTTTNEDGEQETETHTLGEMAALEEDTGVASIHRDNQTRTMTVSAETLDGYNTSLLAREVEKLLEGYQPPAGYTVEISGESTTIAEAMGDLVLMILLAVVFIYLIMVAQFQSLLSPFIVMFTMPLAFTGGLLGLLAAGQTLSVISMLGFLVLAGVVVNNGIVFVDYANQLRLEGMEKREALVATGRSRIRPILMTALTTILAMCTMVFSQEASAAMARPMAIVTIGGLAYATLLTLLIVPVLYDILFRRELKKVDLGEE